jgi:alkylation response protein AidB-like acyl-CoA dehydrogenase
MACGDTAFTTRAVLDSRGAALERARALVPLLRERAHAADQERRLADDVIEALAESGLLRLMAPRVFGGSQLGFAALIETAAEIAAGCGSTGWVYAVLAGHNWMLSLFPPETQREVFADPNALIASVVRLGGKPPRRVAGGYLFEGAAGKYCSGIDHAAWVLAGASLDNGNGSPEARYFLLPKSDLEIVDDWFTVGLRGTGSHSLRIARAFVPENRSCSVAEMTTGTAPGTLFHDAARYRAPFPQVLPLSLAGVPIGIARAALSVFAQSYGRKLASFSEEQVAEQGAGFLHISESHADIEAAAALVLGDAAAIDALDDGSAASALDRARYIWNIAYAGHRCRLAVASLFEASGGSAIYDTFDLQRIWRYDNGLTWQELPAIGRMPGHEKWTFPPPPHIAHTKGLTFDPGNPNVIYAAIEQGALLKSTDGGVTWRELGSYYRPDDIWYKDVHRLVCRPSNPDELFMATGIGLYRSGDAGETWERLTDMEFTIGYPDQIILSPRDDSIMFVSGAGRDPSTWRTSHQADGTVLRTRDGGRTWENANRGLPQASHANIKAMNATAYPGGYVLFAGNTDGEVFATEDGGDNWVRIASGLKPVSKGGHFRNLQTVPA